MPVQTQIAHLPFAKGQSEGVDAKLLPGGWFKSAKNIRFAKDLAVAKRYSVEDHARYVLGLTNQFNALYWVGSYGTQRILAARQQANSGYRSLYSWNDAGGWWSPLNRDIDMTAPQRIFTAATTDADDFTWCESMYNNGFVAFAWQISSSISQVAILDAASETVVSVISLSNNDAENPRLVAVGNTIVVVWYFSGNLYQRVFDTTAPEDGWDTEAALSISGHTPSSSDFDIAPYVSSSTQYLVAFAESATDVITARITVSTATYSHFADETLTGSGPVAVGGTVGRGINVVAHYESTGAIILVSYEDDLTSKSGPTTVNTSSANSGPPSLVEKDADEIYVAWSGLGSGSDGDGFTKTVLVNVDTHALGTIRRDSQTRMASKIFLRRGEPWYWAVTHGNLSRVYVLVHASGADSLPHATLARNLAVAAETQAHLGPVSGDTSLGANDVTMYWAYPYIAKGLLSSTAPFAVSALAKFGATTKPPQMAVFDSMLYLAGGLLRSCDGTLVHECGFLAQPDILSSSSSNGSGSLTNNGVYQYTLVREYIDGRGKRIMGPPSDPLGITLGASDDTVDITFNRPPLGYRATYWESGGFTVYVKTHVFRTENAGEIFYRVTDDDGVSGETGADGVLSFEDLVSDADLVDNEPLYTQGERGGLSGQLQHDPAPPCGAIWATKDRLVLGKLEDKSEWRVSKKLFPGEPATFSEDTAFRGRVNGDVTAVAALDDRILIGTKDAWYEYFGEGPDDSGVGSFSGPRRIPCESGPVQWEGLLEVPQGLFYVGGGNRLYLLPRGGGVPTWSGQPVRDTIDTYSYFRGAVLIPDENAAFFLVTDDDASDGAILRFDTRNGQWSVDTPESNEGYFSCAVWRDADGTNPKLALNTATAIRRESASFTDPSSAFVDSVLEMGDFAPFGPNGWGRVIRVFVLAEYRADSALKLEISYDSGQSWPHSKTWQVTSLTSGDKVEREYWLPRQKCDRVRVRLTNEEASGGSPSEGLIFNAVSWEYYQQKGLPRTALAARG